MKKPSRRPWRRFLALGISLALLALLVHSVDTAKVGQALRGVEPVALVIGLLLFVPQSLAIAWRWRMIARPLADLPMGEAARQVLAANCLNLVLPSKLGDLGKGVFLHRRGHCALDDGLQVVVFEKLLDLAALCALMIVGWAMSPRWEWWVLGTLGGGAGLIALVAGVYFIPREHSLIMRLVPAKLHAHPKFRRIESLLAAGPRVMALVHADGRRRGMILGASFAIWILHLLQIDFFFLAMRTGVPSIEVFARMPIAIFAGLLPLTIAGVGVRDWALLAVFSAPGIDQAALVGAGLLVTLRYIVPALGGVPFVGGYLLMAREAEPGAG